MFGCDFAFWGVLFVPSWFGLDVRWFGCCLLDYVL